MELYAQFRRYGRKAFIDVSHFGTVSFLSQNTSDAQFLRHGVDSRLRAVRRWRKSFLYNTRVWRTTDQGRLHMYGHCGHDHSNFRRAMATNCFGHSTFALHTVYTPRYLQTICITDDIISRWTIRPPSNIDSRTQMHILLACVHTYIYCFSTTALRCRLDSEKFWPKIDTRNTLDCDQSNYSSRITFSHIPIEFGQKGISAIRSADPKTPS